LLSATEEGGGRCAVSRGPWVKKLFTYLNFCSLQRFNTAKESEQPGSFYLVGELRKLLFPRANLRHFVLRFTITRSLIDNNMRWALWGESSIGSDRRMYRRPISLSHPQRKKKVIMRIFLDGRLRPGYNYRKKWKWWTIQNCITV